MKKRVLIFGLFFFLFLFAVLYIKNAKSKEVPSEVKIYEMMKTADEDSVMEEIVVSLAKEGGNKVNLYEALSGYLSKDCRANYFPVFLLKLAAKEARNNGKMERAIGLENEIELFMKKNPSLKRSGMCGDTAGVS
ncbi:hypothetical protein [Chitiniphilus eburneus]|uniref:Uncharacterized protein n=1 Tax=Chitiniphilus eburneus TaxID=2571148 RepID=A0A4U0PZ75_9NEIS|nr:hypothetical protein [Chitiniphilus eburneus]TJZ73889.1 hypothetical protein FAZ21_09745 [Chitiniphilus eburneus]